jgi:RHS repeat-associated protein
VRDDIIYNLWYRWLGDGSGSAVRTTWTGSEGGVAAARYTGISVTLYGNGEAMGMNRTGNVGSRGGSVYLGKDILGSVRSASNEYGTLEGRYEYDAFGKPYAGDLESGMNLGYTGKPYDTATGLYNYGYRDYKPEAARFTTVDPVRDGTNWFAYVNNDPVNWVDPWGLIASDVQAAIANTPQTTLGNLVNTNNLAAIISNNTNLLDATTANYVKSLTTAQVTSELNNITVAMGVDKAAVLAKTASYGVSLPSNIDALTVGNTVMVFSQLSTDSSGRITNLNDANLLAHESIHSLQVNARGSAQAFMDEYINDPASYPGEALEKAAYNFGPYNSNAIRTGSLPNPILNDPNNKDWFK